MYNIDTIPAKIYFKIVETGNLSLLSPNEKKEDALLKAWKKINQEYQRITFKSTTDKLLELSKKIQSLSARFKFIRNCCYLLKIQRDDELEEDLRLYNYKLREECFMADLNRIETLSDTIEIKIEALNEKLQNLSKSNDKSNALFEEVFMGYLAVLGFGFKDANTITLLEFVGLEKQVTIKIKSLQKNG
ncbi:conserved protein of unknown function [Tenacibaculum sp. 190524A02b]|uniref:hypothetical protein n=1 Tax=Tenacibaculum vairaonense TaxID=3137860 RepID=UPI0032B1C3B8